MINFAYPQVQPSSRRSGTLLVMDSEGDDLDRLCPPIPFEDELPRVIGRQAAFARGLSRRAIEHRLKVGRWRRVLPRTYLTTDTFTQHDRAWAALIYAGAGAALSGAAALRESEVRRIRPPDRVLVIVPAANRTRSVGWVEVTRSYRPFPRDPGEGLRRVTVARAVADLGLRTSRLDDVRAIVARVIQDGHCAIDDIGVELESGPRRGSAHLRRALQEVGWGAASAPEAEAARVLTRGGITGFIQNATLKLPDGTTRVIDFYWPALRACLEIDSLEWHFTPADWSRTLDRHLSLTKFGYSVIHRPPSALRDRRQFLRDISEWLDGRAAEIQRGAG